MGIFEKLLEIRQAVAKTISKKGYNKNLDYHFFRLEDLLDPIEKQLAEHDLLSLFNMDDKEAVLSIVNTKNPEEVVEVKMPTARFPLNNDAHTIQEIGATMTYCRRYLYLSMFAISEPEHFDAVHGSTQGAVNKGRNQGGNPNNGLVTEKELAELQKEVERLGLDKSWLVIYAQDAGFKSPRDMTNEYLESARREMIRSKSGDLNALTIV